MGDSEKELRMIFQGQEAMSDAMRSLNQKMDEIIGKKTLLGGGGGEPKG